MGRVFPNQELDIHIHFFQFSHCAFLDVAFLGLIAIRFLILLERFVTFLLPMEGD
jgi:hypothetical protein